MKKLLTIALLSAALAGCTSREVINEGAPQNKRFRAQSFTIDGSWFVVITDGNTGREYLSRQRGGIVELNPAPRQ